MKFEHNTTDQYSAYDGQMLCGKLMSAEGNWMFFAEENSPLFAETLKAIAIKLDELNSEERG